MSNQNLPVVAETEGFIAEFEVMDLEVLKTKNFLVAVSSGDRNGPKFVCSTVRGPYDFYDMIEQVGVMWRNHTHHAKVIILDKDPTKAQQRLDENTTDYIEAHYDRIAVEGLLEGFSAEEKEFTCRANVVEDDGSDDPRKQKDDAAK